VLPDIGAGRGNVFVARLHAFNVWIGSR
jgi:hypothetical protein